MREAGIHQAVVRSIDCHGPVLACVSLPILLSESQASVMDVANNDQGGQMDLIQDLLSMVFDKTIKKFHVA